MAARSDAILLEKRKGIAYITFNRPKVLNAFRPMDYYLLDDLVNDCDQDPKVRAIIFTGKGQPPKEVPNTAEVKKLVSGNPNTIGYIEKSAVDSSVKVVWSE